MLKKSVLSSFKDSFHMAAEGVWLPIELQAQIRFILYTLLMWWYSVTNSGAKGLQCYGSVSPRFYTKELKNHFHNDALGQDLDMFFFLLHNNAPSPTFELGKYFFSGQRRLLSCHFHHIIQIMHFFHSPKFKTFLISHLFKFRQTLAQPLVSSSEGYLNQSILTRFQIVFRVWNYAFRIA